MEAELACLLVVEAVQLGIRGPRSRRQDARLEKFSWQSVESGGSRSSKR
jgi:hypothetical protein